MSLRHSVLVVSKDGQEAISELREKVCELEALLDSLTEGLTAEDPINHTRYARNLALAHTYLESFRHRAIEALAAQHGLPNMLEK